MQSGLPQINPQQVDDTVILTLAQWLEAASPHEIVEAAVERLGLERVALVSSFGTESAALLKIVADVSPDIAVIFLDTGWLFPETLSYRDRLVDLLRLANVHTVQPDADLVRAEDPERDLWFNYPDACCALRKVEPMERALQPYAGWFNGRKRFQGGDRSSLSAVERDGARLKFNPLANVNRGMLRQIFEDANLPPHPLQASGFSSVGCMPCTSRTLPGEDERAGRWRGRGKTECGIHVRGKA